MKYSECKLKAIRDESRIIKNFIKWIQTIRRPRIILESEHYKGHTNIEKLLAEYFNIEECGKKK